MHHAPMPSPVARIACCLLAFALIACSGEIIAPASGEGATPGPSGGKGSGRSKPDAANTDPTTNPAAPGAKPGTADPSTTMPDEPAIDCTSAAADPGPSPLRLLSREQYLNTVRDLFGEVAGLVDALGPASDASAFGLVQPDVSQVQLESYQDAAELIAASVTQDAGKLAQIAPCKDPSKGQDCARSMLAGFGARAYRAPLDDPDDVDRHLALFAVGAETSYAHGIELLLRGVLQAPRFLYQVELGSSDAVGDAAVKLSAHELAARLSYMVWGSLPDDALTAAAQDGTLDSRGGVSAQLSRMLADQRGSSLVRRFLESWVHLADLERVVKSPELYPQWQMPELRAALRAQASGFFDHVLGEEGGTLSALLTSRATTVDDALGDYALDASQSSGLLTLPALLARLAKPDESSPIYRGKFVREALLCQQLPSPPANVPKPPEVQAGVSTRERLRQHEVDPVCSGCHQLLDPLGFGFEQFDAVGRFRTTDGGKAVDTHGNVIATRDIDGEFEGVAELGSKLASSEEVEECMAKQWFRFAVNRFEQDFDACSMQRLLEIFRASGRDLNVLPRAIVETDAFLYRRPVQLEAAP